MRILNNLNNLNKPKQQNKKVTSVSTPPKPKSKPAKKDRKAPVHVAHQGPGCNAADNTVLVNGYLDGLARGNKGFGVLAIGKTKLEEGARSCDGIGHSELGNGLRKVADTLPQVSDRKTARAASKQLRPLADQAWELGRTCKGTMERLEGIHGSNQNI